VNLFYDANVKTNPIGIKKGAKRAFSGCFFS
jgi:hypothetical protein